MLNPSPIYTSGNDAAPMEVFLLHQYRYMHRSPLQASGNNRFPLRQGELPDTNRCWTDRRSCFCMLTGFHNYKITLGNSCQQIRKSCNSHLWFVDKSTLSVIIFAKIIYFVIILLSQAVVRTLSRQPFFYTVRYSFPLFYIFPGNRKTRRTEVLRVSYVWTQRYLAITNLYSDCITRWL